MMVDENGARIDLKASSSTRLQPPTVASTSKDNMQAPQYSRPSSESRSVSPARVSSRGVNGVRDHHEEHDLLAGANAASTHDMLNVPGYDTERLQGEILSPNDQIGLAPPRSPALSTHSLSSAGDDAKAGELSLIHI